MEFHFSHSNEAGFVIFFIQISIRSSETGQTEPEMYPHYSQKSLQLPSIFFGRVINVDFCDLNFMSDKMCFSAF